MKRSMVVIKLVALIAAFITTNTLLPAQTVKKDDRMDWWRDARFGLFIHWGLYAIPAGEWNGNTSYGEWIRHSAQIPLATYDKFVQQFNPVKFNADEWVKMAKDAGMKYIVITSKHHDGFCNFDTKQTDFDVMSTPFHRDILKELSEACKKQGIQLCFYHSIMDWHHPDYLPRRSWEIDRPTAGADYDRFRTYLKSELKELLTNYGKIGVLWFDGEWEDTWTHEMGKDLYKYVRSLQPSIIINNRVDKGREGMRGVTKTGDYAGDFGTPEQEIPATGMHGVDWESCMTMNNNWGYNSHDDHWKSSEDLVQKLIDIASKGGNFLLNIGPTSEGVFPGPSIERLKDMGSWMKTNSESIYGTSASPFKKLDWGRCTQKAIPGGTRLYLHVFNWPADGKLVVGGLGNKVTKVYALADKAPLKNKLDAGNNIVDLSSLQKQEYATVIVMDIQGKPVVYVEPEIQTDASIFVQPMSVRFNSTIPNAVIRFTTDGTEPIATSSGTTPYDKKTLRLTKSVTIKAKCFLNGKAVTGTTTASFEKVTAWPAQNVTSSTPGLQYAQYEGKWSKVPDFSGLTPAVSGTSTKFDIRAKIGKEYYGYTFEGLIKVPADDVYTFYISSDDGSKLLIDNNVVIDHDGFHSMTEKSGEVPLAAGYHTIKVLYFQATGGEGLELSWKRPGTEKMAIPESALYR